MKQRADCGISGSWSWQQSVPPLAQGFSFFVQLPARSLSRFTMLPDKHTHHTQAHTYTLTAGCLSTPLLTGCPATVLSWTSGERSSMYLKDPILCFCVTSLLTLMMHSAFPYAYRTRSSSCTFLHVPVLAQVEALSPACLSTASLSRTFIFRDDLKSCLTFLPCWIMTLVIMCTIWRSKMKI